VATILSALTTDQSFEDYSVNARSASGPADDCLRALRTAYQARSGGPVPGR